MSKTDEASSVPDVAEDAHVPPRITRLGTLVELTLGGTP